MNPYDKANELAKAISESEQFKKYQAAALEVDKKEEYQKMVKDFINFQIEMSSYQMDGKEIPDDLKDRFNVMYSTMSNVSAVNDFLQAQLYFATMLDDITKIISQASDTGAEFLKPENFNKK